MKGQLFTLESGIAILMILLIIIFLYQNPPTSPEFKRINYKLKVYDGLQVLEESGDLRKDVIKENASDINVSSIKNKIRPYIPGFLSLNVTIFNETDNITEKPDLDELIKTTGAKNETLSVSYFLAGDYDDYKPREVRVYLWGFK